MRGARFDVGGREYAVLELDRTEPELPASFTREERSVAILVLDGLSSGEIARRRGTAPRTVANQLRSIYKKAGVGSRADLVRALRAHGRAPAPS